MKLPRMFGRERAPDVIEAEARGILAETVIAEIEAHRSNPIDPEYAVDLLDRHGRLAVWWYMRQYPLGDRTGWIKQASAHNVKRITAALAEVFWPKS